MRFAILMLAWITPAVIAGVLGWKGIWGSGSAFFDYLIPIPVAGGIFHVPSFLVAAFVVLSARKLPDFIVRYLPILAFGVFLIALSLQLDEQRINAWLFTDYSPARSIFKFGKNPLYLFVASDAFWVSVYASFLGRSVAFKYWLSLAFVPIAVLGAQAVLYQFSGPVFKMGGSTVAGTEKNRNYANHISVVYTSSAYDEKAFMAWLGTKNYFARPWLNPNYENAAIVFTNSMQIIKWAKYTDLNDQNTIATVCLYEQDKSITPHKGVFDCFAGRETVSEKIGRLAREEPTGHGKVVDDWYARLRMCKDVEIPPRSGDIALFNICGGLKQDFDRDMKKFAKWFGEDSDRLNFIKSKAAEYNLR